MRVDYENENAAAAAVCTVALQSRIDSVLSDGNTVL